MPRFFLPPGEWTNSSPLLDSGESRHASEVLRLSEGSRLTVFDGAGSEAIATIAGTQGRQVRLVLGAKTRSSPMKCTVTLAQAVPKGRNMDLIVQKAVELGASRIAPLLSERTIVRLEAEESERRGSKWKETALEACKQCGQNYLPEVLAPVSPARFFEAGERSELMLVASLQHDARPIKAVLASDREERGRPPASVTILVGPEGDFTPAELALAKSNGCLPVTLGPIILRTETAALYCLSVLAHELFG